MNFNDFPLELREIIYYYIVDKESILNSRLVCREWYNYLKNFKEYYDLGAVIEYRFEKNKFITKNLILNLIIKEIEFMNYGKYKYIEYDELGNVKKEIISKPPYKLLCRDFSINTINKNEFDARKYEIDKKTEFRMIQGVHPGCIIC